MKDLLKLLTSSNSADLQKSLTHELSASTLAAISEYVKNNPKVEEAQRWLTLIEMKEGSTDKWDDELVLPLLFLLSDFNPQALKLGYQFDGLTVTSTLHNHNSSWIVPCSEPHGHLALIGFWGSYYDISISPNTNSKEELVSIATLLLDDWNQEDFCIDLEPTEGEIQDMVGPFFVDAKRKIITSNHKEFPEYSAVEDIDVSDEDGKYTWGNFSAFHSGNNQTEVIFTSGDQSFQFSEDFLWVWLSWKEVPIDQRPSNRPFDDVHKEALCDLSEKVFNIPRAQWDILTYF